MLPCAKTNHFVDKLIVMDDGKYFTLSHVEIKGNDEFYAVRIEDISNNV